MAIGLRAVMNESLIQRFQGLASGASGQSVLTAFSGQSSQTTVSSGLRTGARTFASGLQGLNTAIAFLNTSQATLEKLEVLTDDLIALAETASKSTSSNQQRRDADAQYHRIANEFQKIVSDAKIGEREFLTLDGLSEFLTVVGLDKDKSESIAAVFDQFKVPEEDDSLASEEIKGPQPARIPSSAYSATARVTVDYDALFDEDVTLRTRPNAYKVLGDLNALKEQINKNQAALENGVEIIGKNIDLVRAAGLAFLELSDQISDDAEASEVANQLRAKIQRDAPAALSQAENLEAIVVAALSLSTDSLGLSE